LEEKASLSARFDFQISFPRKEDVGSNLIRIVGHEASAKAARDDILKIVGDYKEIINEVVQLDARIHSRIIGQRGRHVRQIMDDFKVNKNIYMVYHGALNFLE
jgi:hypothetical protein